MGFNMKVTPEIEALTKVCEENSKMDVSLYGKYDVKRGLRDINGKGVLAGLTQFISVKLQPQPATDQENPMASSMKMMTYTMPLFSVFLGFTLPAGLGLYWAVSAIVRCVQQLAINKYLSKKSTEELIAENQKKAAKKREKKGTSAQEINKMATTSTKNVTAVKKSSISEDERKQKLEKAAEYSKNAKEGSLASKANLVSRYNSSNSKK